MMWVSLLLAAMAAGDPVVIAEFDEPELPASLSVLAAQVRRVEDGAGGALEVTAIAPPKDGRAIVALKLPVKDLRGFEAISFRASASKGTSATFLEFASAGGWRGLWAKEILAREPREFVIPLKQFREFVSGLSADPANLHWLRICWTQDPGTVRIDSIRLLPGSRGDASSRRTLEDWTALAFPAGKTKVVNSKTFALVTDIELYQGTAATKLLSSLEDGVRLLQERYGLRAAGGGRIPVFLFRSSALMDDFARIASGGPPTQAGGASLCAEGIPCGLSEPGKVPWVPALLHSAMHAVIGRALATCDRGDWLEESLVSAIHRKLHPDSLDLAFFRPISAESFRLHLRGESSNVVPLKEIVRGGAAGATHVPMYASIGDFLATKGKPALEKVWTAYRGLDADPSSAGVAAVAHALGTTDEELGAEWIRWGAASFK